jgi:hypothetical protein
MRVVLVPATLALLPEYSSIDDPVADLRTAATRAVAWLLEDGPARVAGGSPVAERVGAHLLGAGRAATGGGLLVIANGSATRTEKAPGHFDERAETFDKSLGQALRTGDSAALAHVDEALAQELWADVGAFRSLGSDIDLAGAEVHVDYDDAPYGVQYWVVRWQCGS